ncbi:tRNA pseudouridine(38-40) synthase TruA [Fusibacter bizertensis]|uniref:tRNA pseudouridine synthase A n=1 Tax=Fusibacter bizertensis TaxID=1488331 RepID=A0ABT6NHD1_9FIRM|nr:tRNA pseudouridine(38-40) synthase TruA [Fusibacter bizertensis]MDH8679816.1 tRNA pseudouridine(38-40) synthase TruA [Fusibacter bizertensis]
MQTVQLKIVYDGSSYCGWQRQSKQPSIQEEIEKVLTKLLGEKITIDASGRTDAGVHALEQSVTFATNLRLPIEQLKRVINRRLPKEIYVLDASIVNNDFHARYSAIAKAYEYRIYTEVDRNPFLDKYSYHYPKKMNIDAIKRGLEYFLGKHDFKTYMASGSNKKDTVRTIYALKLYEEANAFRIVIVGDGFLYNMVRIIIGTLLQIGEEIITPEMVSEIIKSGDRSRARLTAPASGLYLKKVFYSETEREEFIAKM